MKLTSHIIDIIESNIPANFQSQLLASHELLAALEDAAAYIAWLSETGKIGDASTTLNKASAAINKATGA